MSKVIPRPTVVHQAAPVPPSLITAERYVSRAWMETEAEMLWPRMWLFACLERDLDQPGEYRVANIGDESILITRTKAGELAAFYNVCQHRGARVIVNDHGWVANFVCPYHGWTYDYSGLLSVVPEIEGFAGRIDCAERSLKPVRVESWLGMVWICMDPAAVSLREFLGPVADIVAPYQLEHMQLMEDQSVQLDCNWKAVYDNFGELYHVEHIHPQHQSLFDCPTSQIHLFENGHTGVLIDGHTVNTRLPIPDELNAYLAHRARTYGADPADYSGRVLALRKDIQKLRREAGPRLGYDYSAMTDERLSDIEQYNIFPNTMITVQPDEALVMRARPHPTDPNKCFWDKFTFRRPPSAEVARQAGVTLEAEATADGETYQRPTHDEFTQDEIIAGDKTMTITIDQDIHLIRDVQAGMRSRGFSTAMLSDEEARVQHYHDWLDHFMGQQATRAARAARTP